MRRYFYILVLVITLLGCQQSELCYDHPHYAKTTVAVDLTDTGYTFEDDLLSYTVIFYPVDDGIRPLSELTPVSYRMQQASDFYISVEPGDYRVVMYSDYSGQNLFFETDSYDDVYCEATSLALAASQLRGDLLDEEEIVYAAEPDPLVISHMDDVTIIEGDNRVDELSGQVLTIPATRVTTTFNAKIWISNTRSISSYSGHVGYVDSRYYITQDRSNHGGLAIAYTDENSGIVSSGTNSDGTSMGYLTIKVTMFGFTQTTSTLYNAATWDSSTTSSTTRSDDDEEYNSVNPGDAYLYLDLDLKGETTEQTEFKIDITDYVNQMSLGDASMPMIELGSIDEPYVPLPVMIEDSEDEDSGFFPTVDDWDDENEFVLDFGSGTVTPVE